MQSLLGQCKLVPYPLKRSILCSHYRKGTARGLQHAASCFIPTGWATFLTWTNCQRLDEINSSHHIGAPAFVSGGRGRPGFAPVRQCPAPPPQTPSLAERSTNHMLGQCGPSLWLAEVSINHMLGCQLSLWLARQPEVPPRGWGHEALRL